MRGLYIHIPFCVKKCSYCDFVSYCSRLGESDAYIDALIREMSQFSGEAVDTIFIGGGTPTVLSTKQLERVCSAVFANFSVGADYEFSIEANPGTIDYEKARCLVNSGVNRISLGVQSFNDSELEFLGRIHNSATACDTVKEVNRAGFSNINIDIMTGLPYQNTEKLTHTLDAAVQLPVKHISAYSLIVEEGTPLCRDYDKGLFELPGEDSDRAMYAMTAEYLKSRGFNQYEISNFAMPGFECAHNIKYWECREYFGIGAAAHSYVNGVRYENTPELGEYISGKFRLADEVRLSRNDMIFEFIMMGMRMNKGISEAEFARRFGMQIDELYKKQLDKFAAGGFIERVNGQIRFTDAGRDVSNSVLCEFICD